MPSVPPDDQTPSIFGSEGSCAAVFRWAVAESHMPVYFATTWMPECFLKTSIAPVLRFVWACVPAPPVTMTTFPLPLSLSTMYWAFCCPYWYWLPLILIAHG